MKKFDKKIILLFLSLGVGAGVLDTIFDYLVFYAEHGTFMELFITNVPKHEIYIRLAIMAIFVLIGVPFSYYITELKQSRTELQNIFNNVIPICITTSEYDIIGTNKSYDKIFGAINKAGGGVKCYNHRPGPKCRTNGCPITQVSLGGKEQFTCESVNINDDGTESNFVVTATPYLDPDGNRVGIIETFQDITPRRKLEREKEKLITNLQEAIEKVKVLSGFLPICASCKKIRDDKGYWTQIETYIRDHSEAEFSHGICPDCAEKHYSQYKK